MKITLVDRRDTYNFALGVTVAQTKPGALVMIRNPNGHLTWRGFWYVAWQRATRPFRRHAVVSAIDHETGTITLSPAPKRWWHFL